MSSLQAVLDTFKDKYVEISVGDEFEEVVYSDNIKKNNGVIYGKLKDISGDFIIIECLYIDINNELKTNCKVFINSWQVKAIVEMKANGGSLADVFLGASDSKKIRKMLGISDG